jgi:hypothetical protein
MATVDTSKLSAAVQAAMDDLVGRIREEANDRGKVASGRTLASLRTSVLSSTSVAIGSLYGGDWWKYVGNGRGPGRMPPVGAIQQWINSKGLNLSAWAVAKRIALDGSRDHRLGRTNIFTDSIAAWQEGEVFEAVGAAGVEVFGDAYVQSVRAAFNQQQAA